jgi:hypothetical protein
MKPSINNFSSHTSAGRMTLALWVALWVIFQNLSSSFFAEKSEKQSFFEKESVFLTKRLKRCRMVLLSLSICAVCPVSFPTF